MAEQKVQGHQIKRCPRQRKGQEPCGGQMLRESGMVMHSGRWHRSIISPDPSEVDQHSVVSYNPPPFIKQPVWVCLQCGYEMAA